MKPDPYGLGAASEVEFHLARTPGTIFLEQGVPTTDNRPFWMLQAASYTFVSCADAHCTAPGHVWPDIDKAVSR